MSKFYVTDGQARLTAMNKNKASSIPESLSFVREGSVKPVSLGNRFKARLFAGDPIAVNIDKLVMDHGFVLDLIRSQVMLANGIRGILRIEKSFKDHQHEFPTALKLLQNLYNNGVLPYKLRTGDFIYSVCKFFAVNKTISLNSIILKATSTPNFFCNIWNNAQQDTRSLICRGRMFELFAEYLAIELS